MTGVDDAGITGELSGIEEICDDWTVGTAKEKVEGEGAVEIVWSELAGEGSGTKTGASG